MGTKPLPSDRCGCRVLWCNRTRGKRKGEREAPKPGDFWICGEHWRLLDRSLKRRIARCEKLARQIIRRRRRQAEIGGPLHRLYERLLQRASDQANERAAGISAAERPARLKIPPACPVKAARRGHPSQD